MLAVGVVILVVGVAGFSYVRGPVHVGGGSIHGAWTLDEIKDADLAEWTNPYGNQWPTGHPTVIFTVEPDISLFIDPRLVPSGDPAEYHDQIGCSFDGFYRVVGDRIESHPSPATLALRLCVYPPLDHTFRTARWAANDTTLILTTDANVTAVFETLPQTELVGVWRLHELEGRETEAEATLTFHPDSRVSGYVGCPEWGSYRIEGNSLTLADWGPRLTTAFPPALSCELQTPDEALFSSLLRSATIWDFNGDELTIGTAEGLTAVLQRA
jgi:heat shock protein HslJ